MSLWEHIKDQCNATEEQVNLVDEALDLCESLTALATEEALLIETDIDNTVGTSDEFENLQRLYRLAYKKYKRRAELIT